MKGHWPEALALIVANLAPIYGVWFWNWSVFDLILLYWLEVLILGVLAVPRTLLVDPSNASLWLRKAIEIPAFCWVFGLFWFVLGEMMFSTLDKIEYLAFKAGLHVSQTLAIIGKHRLWPAVGALLAAHVFVFLSDVAGGAWRRAKVSDSWGRAKLSDPVARPILRLAILFIALWFGAFLYAFVSTFLHAFVSTILVILVLIVLKLWLEFEEHIRRWRGAEINEGLEIRGHLLPIGAATMSPPGTFPSPRTFQILWWLVFALVVLVFVFILIGDKIG